MEDNNNKKDLDPVSGLSLALGLFMFHLKQHVKVANLTALGRKMLLMMCLTGCLSVVALILDAEARVKRQHDVLAAVVEEVYGEFYDSQNKRKSDEEINTIQKKRRTKHDHDRAWQCIQQDYLGPEPTFTDKQFEEVFRLTKGKVERLLQVCCRHNPKTFCPGPDATGRPGIRPEVKVLAVLKCVAFGCSGVAFRDYNQMARNTTSECVKAFFQAITMDEELTATYMRAPSRADAQRISKLHEDKHGIPGLLLSLDCMHVLWKNCPVGQQCHYKNAKKNKMSSVVLEGGVDWNCWFWHASCGHPGTNNDINIWDVSSLQEMFLSREFNMEVDFPFTIDGKTFQRLWCLVDGIYPPIGRFVKTIPVAVGKVMKLFVEWQESARKDSERAFGILVRKFQLLARPIEYWNIEDVKNQMYGCMIMHNMMVEERILRDEREDGNMYALSSLEEESIQEVRHSERDDDQTCSRLQSHVLKSLGLHPDEQYLEAYINNLKQRWTDLYNHKDHARLQEVVMHQVAVNHIAEKKKKRKCRHRGKFQHHQSF